MKMMPRAERMQLLQFTPFTIFWKIKKRDEELFVNDYMSLPCWKEKDVQEGSCKVDPVFSENAFQMAAD